MPYFKWKKGERKLLSQHFSTDEFTCPCHNKGCEDQKINMDLVQKLESVRTGHKQPISITSGYRCQRHQDALEQLGYQTAKLSQHVLGNAADITSRDMAGLTKICEKDFFALGVGKSFLHVDMRSDKRRRWTYS